MRVLVVCDINGIVCHKVQRGKTNAINISPYYDIEPIEGYKEFIKSIMDKHDIGWYSSTMQHNASKILKALELYDLSSVFKWYSTDVVDGHKLLSKVQEHYPGYDLYVIIDDDIEKIDVECNTSGNCRLILFDNYDHVLNRLEELVNEVSVIRDSQERE